MDEYTNASTLLDRNLDQGRADSPLREADGALVVDTSELTVEGIVDALLTRLG